MNKIYRCKCGKIFENPNSFNGHKSMCKIHLGEDKYKKRLQQRRESMQKCKKIVQTNQEKIKKQKIEEWYIEEHFCEYCGKLLKNKYSSGRFCNSICARTYSSRKNKRFDELYGSIYTYREKAFKNLKKECAVCGYNEEINILQVHHIDKNRKNNNLKNLVILCPNCHSKITFCKYELVLIENNKYKLINKEEFMRKFEFVKRVISETHNVVGSIFKLPERSTANSAGYDFFVPERTVCKSHQITMVKSGVKAQFPSDETLLIFNRSSNPKKKGLIILNGVGVVDADYYNNPDNDGEIAGLFYNMLDEDVILEPGDKMMQGIFVKYGITEDDAAHGERNGGFGSTGK